MRCSGLVSLDLTDLIHSQFYENSGMHGNEPTPIEEWLKEAECDDQRRFDMIKATQELTSAYASSLPALGKADTLMSHLELR
jgi:hypothetical protein